MSRKIRQQRNYSWKKKSQAWDVRKHSPSKPKYAWGKSRILESKQKQVNDVTKTLEELKKASPKRELFSEPEKASNNLEVPDFSVFSLGGKTWAEE